MTNLAKNPYDRHRQYAFWLDAARFTVNQAKGKLLKGDVVKVIRTSTGANGWFAQTLDGSRVAWVNESDLTVAN